MNPHLIAAAFFFFAAGFSFSRLIHRRECEELHSALEDSQSTCERLFSCSLVQSDAFNHILKQRNDLQSKLNELTK